jgi:RNA polymerase sigma-70 factor (ECF subfamily)
MVGDLSSSRCDWSMTEMSKLVSFRKKFEIDVNRLTDRDRKNLVGGELTVSVSGAADRLYRRYERRLYRFGVQRLGNNGLADEMVQETFVRLWRTAGNFDAEKASVQTYLYVIARSVAADVRKRPSSRPLLPVEDADMPPQPDTVDQIIDSMIVREALESLGSGHAQVIQLAQDEGLTQSQIAERLGLPLGTVKTRMFHGIRAMRVALAERGFSAL